MYKGIIMSKNRVLYIQHINYTIKEEKIAEITVKGDQIINRAMT